MQLIINLIFLSKSDIWRASDFPISSRSLPFFLLSIFLFLLLLLCQCGSTPRMSHTAFFDYFPCDVECWSATNVMKLVLHCEKIKWCKILFQEGFKIYTEELKIHTTTTIYLAKIWNQGQGNQYKYCYTNLDESQQLPLLGLNFHELLAVSC